MARRDVKLAFSCLHAPFQHPHAITFLKSLKSEYKPDTVVCLGDEVDNHASSRFPHDPDMYSAGHELKAARDALRPLYEAFPVVHVCKSNHTDRFYKRAFFAGLPKAVLRATHEVLGAPTGWNWRRSWVIGDVLYVHGDGFGGVCVNKQAVAKYMHSVVLGHMHTQGGVYWARALGGTKFGVSAGCLIDEDSPVFAYAENVPARPIYGAAVIVDGRPSFIPL